MSRAALGLLLALAACGSAQEDSPGPGADALDQGASAPGEARYHLSYATDLRTVDVRAEFGSRAPAEIRVEDQHVVRGAVAEPSRERLNWNDGRATLPPGTTAVTYHIDLGAAPRESAQRVAAGVLVDPSLLIARPASGPARRLAAEVRVPAGARYVVPWPRAKRGYRIPSSAFTARGWMAVGDFTPLELRVAETDFTCAVLGPMRAEAADVIAFVTEAARSALPLAGSAAPRRVLVLLRPTARTDEAIPFGETLYGGGATLHLLVGANAPGSALRGEWVTVHEMSHLALPRVARADAWFSEGLATYYQSVLRGRSGALDEEAVWSAFASGIQRGRRRAGTTILADESASMGARHAFMRVYWSGAAIALLWDVELRHRHGCSLDDALRAAAATYPPGAAQVPAADVLAHMDAWLGEPLFTSIAEMCLGERSFPDVDPTLRWLGVAAGELDDRAPGAGVRRAITDHATR